MTDQVTAAGFPDLGEAPIRSALASAPLFQERRSPLLGLFQGTTWSAFGYLFTTMLLAPVGFAYAITAISLGLPIAVFIVGLVVSAALILGARGIGAAYRLLANGILRTSIPAPMPPRRRAGITGFVKMGLTDAAGWRALAHSVISFVTALISLVLTATLLSIGLGATTYGLWRPFLPAQEATDGTWHSGAQFGDAYFLDTPGRIALSTIVGLVFLVLIWPAVNNGLARLQAILAASLLGPTASSIARARLEAQRDQAASVTTDRMRSIERDLHDVTQAQLVAIAMKLGDARERLDSGETPASVAASIAAAHDTSKDALADLRSLVRGIHPAALDAGLGTALQTLASRSALPVSLDLRIEDDLTATVESVAYFCAAELLNNVAKHSGADHAELVVRTADQRLLLTVRDGGRGGARGLTSVRGRAGSIGGNVTIESPEGGPTVVTVDLPRILTSA
ncbi:sensor histidine kinase [Rarobacter faecitabidus]|nr:sensor histidine kinase [Rarobacter faecitabidus]